MERKWRTGDSRVSTDPIEGEKASRWHKWRERVGFSM